MRKPPRAKRVEWINGNQIGVEGVDHALELMMRADGTLVAKKPIVDDSVDQEDPSPASWMMRNVDQS